MKKTKNTTLTVFFLMCLSLSGGVMEAWAESPDKLKEDFLPDVYVGSTFATKYIWRGQNLCDDPVIQPEVSVSKWGFTFNVWSNYDTGETDKLTELDYTLDYTFSLGDALENLSAKSPEYLGKLYLKTGYTYYTFPSVDWKSEGFDSHEVYFGAYMDIFLKPSITWYWDVDDGHGSYYRAGISHTFQAAENVSLDLGVSAAYNDGQWTGNSGWSDMLFTGGVNVKFLKYFTVRPFVSYSLILDRDTYDDTQENEFYGGVTVSVAF